MSPRTSRAAAVVGPPAHGASDMGEFEARLAELDAEYGLPTQVGSFVAHSDGACLCYPVCPGGWAAVVEREGGTNGEWELWGHLSSTSNNRAEALGLLAALEWVPAGSTLLVRSDSELTVKIFTGSYKAKANTDIWSAIRRVQEDKRLTVRSEWVRGHAGDVGNERADALSVLGAVDGDTERWARIRSNPRRAAAPAPSKAAPPEELAGLEPRGAWETSFVGSVAKQLRAGRALSEKQQAVIDRIRARGAEKPE